MRYQSELLGTLFYLVGNIEDARDALQEAFVKCWKHREEVGSVENMKAWIFRIVLNTGRDIRQTAWRRKRTPLPDGEQVPSSRADDPANATIRHEEEIALRQAIAELRPEEQEIFLLRQNGQLTYEEIAKAVGIPTGTVKTRMRLALNRLREVLADA